LINCWGIGTGTALLLPFVLLKIFLDFSGYRGLKSVAADPELERGNKKKKKHRAVYMLTEIFLLKKRSDPEPAQDKIFIQFYPEFSAVLVSSPVLVPANS
jgi:hypothetical protein